MADPRASGSIVVNLWFIKHSNGLFHYGLDYAEALSVRIAEIWVRDDAMARLAARRLPCVPIRILTIGSMLRAAIASGFAGQALFTPSSHPIPFLPRQTIVVHDSFPFQGKSGRLKRLLFRIGLVSSRASGGYINRADAKRFLEASGVRADRLRYLPNRIDDATAGRARATIVADRVLIGLLGTDSPKKNYDLLFTAIEAIEPGVAIEWMIYGHENNYTLDLRQRHPNSVMRVVSSDEQSMDNFIDTTDVVVSVAQGEGFGRPIARALMRGVPTMLLDTPVFREFYAGSARLFPSVEELAKAIARWRAGDRVEGSMLKSAAALRADFAAGVAGIADSTPMRR